MEEVLIPIVVFGFAFATIYVFLTIRNKERMALIEKGANAELFKGKPIPTQYLALKFGLFFVGIALGVLVGSLLDTYTGLDEGPCYLFGIFFFGGLGLVAGYLLQSKIQRKNED